MCAKFELDRLSLILFYNYGNTDGDKISGYGVKIFRNNTILIMAIIWGSVKKLLFKLMRILLLLGISD